MAKSQWRKEQDAREASDRSYAAQAHAGTLPGQGGPTGQRPYRPNVVLQARDVRNRLSDRYSVVGSGGAAIETTPHGKGFLRKPVVRPANEPTQPGTPGMRAGIINTLGTRTYSNRAATKGANPDTIKPSTSWRQEARKAIGSVAITAANAKTIFTEGLRAKLAKKT